MAWQQEDADRLRAAIARGERTVQFADRSVTYRSTAELLEALRVVEAAIAGRRRTRTGAGGKGL